jgi:hypothetical protein
MKIRFTVLNSISSFNNAVVDEEDYLGKVENDEY